MDSSCREEEPYSEIQPGLKPARMEMTKNTSSRSPRCVGLHLFLDKVFWSDNTKAFFKKQINSCLSKKGISLDQNNTIPTVKFIENCIMVCVCFFILWYWWNWSYRSKDEWWQILERNLQKLARLLELGSNLLSDLKRAKAT